MNRPLRIALVADSFPPICTSGAVQLRDLSRELIRQGHKVTVLLPEPSLKAPWRMENIDNARVLRLKAPKTRETNYIQRTIGEFLMPFAMRRNFRRSPIANEKFDGVVWYAPSIFHGPFVNMLKKSSGCKGYLIIRDIFPEWAVDIGLMGRGFPYLFFNAIARYQYSIANVIGVQTAGNLTYFDTWQQQPGHKLEVLQNWLGNPANTHCSIRVNKTPLAGRKIFVYAGNMGIAQGMDIIIDLAEKLSARTDVGFLFVGRGSDLQRLKNIAQGRELKNIQFFEEIHPDEIPDLYAQCDAGIVALDSRHKSHNIPGKFLTYMQCGLPVLANVNSGNDLATMIRNEQVGQVCESNQIDELIELTNKLLKQIDSDSMLSARCHNLFKREFSVEQAASEGTVLA